MSVIIRLQNLPWSANAGDIRTYFQGLSIPEGGVHIVGGEQGDAFIAFSTDEDARQAMLKDGGKLKEVQIKLLLSSRTEMLRVIEQARQQALKLHNIMSAPVQPMVPVIPTTTTPSFEHKKKEDLESDRGKDDDYNNRRRSTSHERGRSRGRSSENERSRDRSREYNRDRRDRERRRRGSDRSRDRSRERYRNRRSRSRDRKRSSRESDRDPKDKNKSRENVPDKVETSLPEKPPHERKTNWDKPIIPPTQMLNPVVKPHLLPDPPGVPQMLLQFQQNGGKDNSPKNPPFQQDERKNFGFQNTMAQTMPLSNRGPRREAEGPVVAPSWPAMVPMQQPMMNMNAMNMPRPPMMPNADQMTGFPNFSMPQSMFPMGGMPDMWQMQVGMNTMSQPEIKKNNDGPDRCIEIRGLPLNVSYVDIKKLFDGLSILNTGIKMINDNHGNRTGIAYVQFTCTAHKKSALNQNGQKVRSNVVEVLHLRDDIYAKAIDNYKPEKDMTSKSDDMDIEGENLEDNWHDVEENGKRGRDKSDSMKSKNLMGKSYTRKDTTGYVNVNIKGLPLDATERDICDFFSELGISPGVINFVFDGSGNPAGEAICSFESELEADTAATKNNTYMGRYLVSVNKIIREDHDGGYRPLMNEWNSEMNFRPHMQQGSGRGRHYGGQNMSEGQGGDRSYRMDDRYERRERRGQDGDSRYSEKREWKGRGGSHGMRGDYHRERGSMRGRGSYMNNGPMRGGRQGGHRSGSPYIDGESVEAFGRPGCVVALENLHFRADIEDIILFFEDFGIENEDVIRRFDDKGRATGDARVALKSPPEAARAVRQLNLKMMKGRTISVSVV